MQLIQLIELFVLIHFIFILYKLKVAIETRFRKLFNPFVQVKRESETNQTKTGFDKWITPLVSLWCRSDMRSHMHDVTFVFVFYVCTATSNPTTTLVMTASQAALKATTTDHGQKQAHIDFWLSAHLKLKFLIARQY